MSSNGRGLALFLCLTALLAGCGSSQSADEPTCTKATIPGAGPGDAGAHFPLGVGDTWAYEVVDVFDGTPGAAYRSRVSVLEPTIAHDVAASVIADANLDVISGQPADRTLLASGPGGVTALGTDDDPITQAAAPFLAAPFPLRAGTSFVAFDCRSLSAGEDLDDDGREERIDARATVTVVGEEAVTVPAGAFTAARVDTQLDMTVRYSSGGSEPAAGVVRAWYAPGLGLVRRAETFTAAGHLDELTSVLYAFDVGGATLDVGPRLALTPGMPVGGTLPRGGWQTYQATVTPGAPLVAAVTAPGPSVGVRWYDGDATLGFAQAGAFGASRTLQGREIQGIAEVRLSPTVADVFLEADAGPASTGPVAYAGFLAPEPDASDLTPEDVQVTVPSVTAGHVGTRSTSTYTATGLTPGATVTIALAGMSGEADLHVYSDAPRVMELDCTLMLSGGGPSSPQACTFTTGADAAWFAVEAGPTNRDGAAYLVMVHAAP